MKRQKKGLQIGLGVTSILMVFVVLCMMILSMLSYHEAIQKETIAKRQVSFQEQYTKGDGAMQFLLHELEGKGIKSIEELQKDQKLLEVLKELHIQWSIDENRVQLRKEINNEQSLAVELQITSDQLIVNSYAVIESGE